jgi:S-adenosylmethionine synthetase
LNLYGIYALDQLIAGKSKLQGEKTLYPEQVILRVPILYGETESNAESAVNVLIDIIQVHSSSH